MRIQLPPMIGRICHHPLRPLEQQLHYRFRHSALLETALTHRSYRAEHPDVEADNQRLEFLGDAVLGLLCAELAYRNTNGSDEGIMTVIRSRLASGQALASTARSIGLGAWLRLGRGEAKSGGHDRSTTLADALESILGAAYLDGGLPAAERVFNALFSPSARLPYDDDPLADNPKGKLQEISQRRFGIQPRYRIVSASGADHERRYIAEVEIDETRRGQGAGNGKQQAERSAAQALLRLLDMQNAVE